MMRHTPQRRTQKYFSRECLVLIKYSNGGRSGVEPDFLKYRNDISLLSVQLFKPYLSFSAIQLYKSEARPRLRSAAASAAVPFGIYIHLI